MLTVCSFREYEKSCEFGILERSSLLLAEEEEEAAIPKKNRRILVRQHFEMRPVLVEFNTTFQNLMNYFSHPLSLKTCACTCNYASPILVNCTCSDVIHTVKSIQI